MKTPLGSAMIIQTADNEFYFVGTGIVTTFKQIEDKKVKIGLLKVDEGYFIDEKWIENATSTAIKRIKADISIFLLIGFSIQRVELYGYKQRD